MSLKNCDSIFFKKLSFGKYKTVESAPFVRYRMKLFLVHSKKYMYRFYSRQYPFGSVSCSYYDIEEIILHNNIRIHYNIARISLFRNRVSSRTWRSGAFYLWFLRNYQGDIIWFWAILCWMRKKRDYSVKLV